MDSPCHDYHEQAMDLTMFADIYSHALPGSENYKTPEQAREMHRQAVKLEKQAIAVFNPAVDGAGWCRK